jgi:hypothetical protein
LELTIPGTVRATPSGERVRRQHGFARSENPEHHRQSGVARRTRRRKAPAPSRTLEGTMATRQHRQIIETPTEARRAEPGPSVLALVAVSTGLAMLVLGSVWYVFFRTWPG